MYSGNSYKNFPALYDLLYQRYLKSVPEFVALVKKNTPVGGLVLDLAAGTGEVTIPLLQSGYKVTSLDSSTGMLGQLKLKARHLGVKDYQVRTFDMRKIDYREKFDSVCVRQAINYFIGIRALESGMVRVFGSLKKGGNFIFNSPNYRGEKSYPVVYHHYQKDRQSAFVVETNKMKKRILRHKQYSIIWEDNKEPNFVTDENSFYMFTENEFAGLLKKAGFSKIKFSGSNKTLYCVATK